MMILRTLLDAAALAFFAASLLFVCALITGVL